MGTVQEYLESGMYLPTFMRDFHGQKDVFKFLDDVQERNIKKNRNGDRSDSVNWRSAQIYTIDIFLWVMARHGYTLQRSRKKLPFSDIERTIDVENDRRREEMAAALGGLLND
ncbi:hypothetical protein [Acetobacter senegalensis]|uniref:hypothetical protein n=1 Tax=Acetobacter senegalensis TaxID=446692 RepID=UPI001EDDD2E8|nr:hypothetical protein [Acetobacter senegalensis]MCG4273941.1 hypothetical protein [Acetobacter senegalensis]